MEIKGIFVLVGLSLATLLPLSGCGSPLIKGWRGAEVEPSDKDKCLNEAKKGFVWQESAHACVKADGDLSLIDEPTCKARPGFNWVDGSCRKDEDLTADQCTRVAGKSWLPDAHRCVPVEQKDAAAKCIADPTMTWIKTTCVPRPTLAVAGNVTQTIAVGSGIQEIDFTTSAGAKLQVANPSCPMFFVVDPKKPVLTSAVADSKTPSSCTADVAAANTDGATSQPVHVTVTVNAGFLGLCQQFVTSPPSFPSPQAAAWHTVVMLKVAVKKESCKDAAKELAAVTELDLSKRGITDLTPLASFPSLQHLDLSDNQVVDVSPLAGLAALEWLNMSGNPLDDGTVPKTTSGGKVNCPTAGIASLGVEDFCSQPLHPKPVR